MAPNSGFQGGPFAQIFSLGPVACGAAAGGISSLRNLAHPQASPILGEVFEGTQAVCASAGSGLHSHCSAVGWG